MMAIFMSKSGLINSVIECETRRDETGTIFRLNSARSAGLENCWWMDECKGGLKLVEDALDETNDGIIADTDGC